jgi:hypothetical protein
VEEVIGSFHLLKWDVAEVQDECWSHHRFEKLLHLLAHRRPSFPIERPLSPIVSVNLSRCFGQILRTESMCDGMQLSLGDALGDVDIFGRENIKEGMMELM